MTPRLYSFMIESMALTALVVVRKKLGLKTLGPLRLAANVATLLAMSYVNHSAEWFAFALAVLAYGLKHVAESFHAARTGNPINPGSRGESELVILMPKDFPAATLARWIDPLAIALVGILVSGIFSLLIGLWLILSAASLAYIEYRIQFPTAPPVPRPRKSPTSQAPYAMPTVEEKLIQLAVLQKENLITIEEYAAKRQKLLAQI